MALPNFCLATSSSSIQPAPDATKASQSNSQLDNKTPNCNLKRKTKAKLIGKRSCTKGYPSKFSRMPKKKLWNNQSARKERRRWEWFEWLSERLYNTFYWSWRGSFHKSLAVCYRYLYIMWSWHALQCTALVWLDYLMSKHTTDIQI